MLQGIMPGLLDALSSFVMQPAFSQRSMNLLGKMGGRSYQHFNGPQDIDYWANHEHGILTVLVFKPSTSFLVPLDRCMRLLGLSQNALGKDASPHFRQQAFRFAKHCLNSMLRLDHPLQDTSNRAADELAGVLVAQSGHDAPLQASSSSSKTRMQYLAEERALEVRRSSREAGKALFFAPDKC
jgi:transformation/transcription domain-associated protein